MYETVKVQKRFWHSSVCVPWASTENRQNDKWKYDKMRVCRLIKKILGL